MPASPRITRRRDAEHVAADGGDNDEIPSHGSVMIATVSTGAEPRFPFFKIIPHPCAEKDHLGPVLVEPME